METLLILSKDNINEITLEGKRSFSPNETEYNYIDEITQHYQEQRKLFHRKICCGVITTIVSTIIIITIILIYR